MNRKRMSLTDGLLRNSNSENRDREVGGELRRGDADGLGGVLVIHRDRDRQWQGVNVVHKA